MTNIIEIDENKKTPKTDDDLSWLDEAITEHPPLNEELKSLARRLRCRLPRVVDG
jgi:hypothetical protein